FLLELLAPEPIPVVELPALEVDPYRGLSPHPEAASARSQALWHMRGDGPRIVVASARAAALRLPRPEIYGASCIELMRNEDVAPERLREQLTDAGYVEDDPVTEPGEFSLRGGILDVFTPQLGDPVRLEFFGDRLESLRSFDVETQRSIATLEHVE